MPNRSVRSRAGHQEFLYTVAVAELLGVRPKTVEKWRASMSHGPPFVRFGRKTVRYPLTTLLRWCAEQLVVGPREAEVHA